MSNLPKQKLNLSVVAKSIIGVGVLILLGSTYVLNNPQLTKPKVEQKKEVTTKNTEEITLPAELTDPTSTTVLVDKTHGLNKDYVPANLASPYLNSTADIIQLRSDAAEQAKAMFEKAKEESVPMFITAGYLSYDQQKDYYEDRVGLLGETEANKYTAKPGFSENQTGLALDITDTANGHNITEFKDTATFQWLSQHAHEYGFILRYPEGKETITDYNYMPWHWRFVGVDLANKIFTQGGLSLSFEEYFQIKK